MENLQKELRIIQNLADRLATVVYEELEQAINELDEIEKDYAERPVSRKEND